METFIFHFVTGSFWLAYLCVRLCGWVHRRIWSNRLWRVNYNDRWPINLKKTFTFRALASVSVFTCSAVALLIWTAIILDGSDNRFKGIGLGVPTVESILQTYGMIIFQFDIHPMLMTIQVDMQQKHNIGSAVCLGIASEWHFLPLKEWRWM